MITSVFSKSRPFNYILVVLMLTLCFSLVHISELNSNETSNLLLKKGLLFLILIGSLFLANFISKKNTLTKNNTFVFLFFFSFLILLPNSLKNMNLIVANFFILLALRRLISLQSLISPKQKIFDASLLIFIATLFHFWCILFILLVFFSIILHVSRDYRNWILPYIAFFAVTISGFLFATLRAFSFIGYIQRGTEFDLSFNYFTDRNQNIALSVYAAFVVLFLFNMLISLSNKPLNSQSAYKKIILSTFIGVAIFAISPAKNNGFLIYTFMPIALMATVYFENEATKWKAETTAILVLGLSFLLFFMQL